MDLQIINLMLSYITLSVMTVQLIFLITVPLDNVQILLEEN